MLIKSTHSTKAETALSDSPYRPDCVWRTGCISCVDTVRGLFSFPGHATRFCKHAVLRWLAWQIGVVLVGSTGSYELPGACPDCDCNTTPGPSVHLVVGRGVKDEGSGTRVQSCHGRTDVPEACAWRGREMRPTKRTRLKQQPGWRQVDGAGWGWG